MATRSTNTYAESLQQILTQVVQTMTLQDANLQFCEQLQAAILGELRAPVTQMMDAGLLPSDQQVPPPAAMAGPPPGGGFMQAPAAPNADELRRLLSVGAA